MSHALTGVRHSSSPESRYETSLALVVNKRLYTDNSYQHNCSYFGRKMALAVFITFSELVLGRGQLLPLFYERTKLKQGEIAMNRLFAPRIEGKSPQ